MTLSDTPKRPNAHWLQICVFLCAVVVLPLAIASAQDYKAVEKRLGEAVANGELSLEQAGVMIDALRKAGGAKKQPAKSKSDTDLESAWQKLQAMVKAGEITKEQAAAKMSAIKKEAAKENLDSDRTEAYLMKVKKELGDAVEAGKISREDAAKKFEAVQKEIKKRTAAGVAKPGPKRMTREDYARAEADLIKLVADGKISKDDLRARLEGMRKMMGGKSDVVGKKDVTKQISREDFANAAIKIRSAIVEGRITKEQGRAKLAAMRKMIGEKSEVAAEKNTDWEGIKKRIEGAVKSGDMTREQADAKYKAIRERLGQKVKDKDSE